MHKRRLLPLVLILIRVSIIYGQTYEYAYDNNGNRISSYLGGYLGGSAVNHYYGR